jgi:hypothetical protein
MTARLFVIALTPPERAVLLRAVREMLKRDTQVPRDVLTMLKHALEQGELGALSDEEPTE